MKCIKVTRDDGGAWTIPGDAVEQVGENPLLPVLTEIAHQLEVLNTNLKTATIHVAVKEGN